MKAKARFMTDYASHVGRIGFHIWRASSHGFVTNGCADGCADYLRRHLELLPFVLISFGRTRSTNPIS
jgi:hypothetical protein